MFYRIAYTFVDVIGEVGGLVEGVKLLLIVLLIPINYNLNSISIMKDFMSGGKHP